MKKTIIAISLISTLTTAARAQPDVSMEAGTTGVSAHVSIPLHSNLSARIGAGYLDGYSFKHKLAGHDYDLKLSSKTFDALLDWYPDKDSGFRVSGGVAYNGNKVDMLAHPDAAGNYTIQGNTYNAASAGTVDGSMDFRKVAPYVGIGWGKPAEGKEGWSVSADVGVLVQGAPNVALTSSGCTSPTANCNQLASDVAKEKTALADEVGRYKVYPVLRVGLNYRF